MSNLSYRFDGKEDVSRFFEFIQKRNYKVHSTIDGILINYVEEDGSYNTIGTLLHDSSDMSIIMRDSDSRFHPHLEKFIRAINEYSQIN